MSLVGRVGAVWKRGGEKARAEEFVLRDRGRIRGVVVQRSNTELVLEVGTGRVTFCLSEIHRVVGGGLATHV